MGKTLNKVMLIGNVGNDPEIKHTPGGIPIVNFRLATTDSWRDKDGTYQEHTDWHSIVAWRGLAEVIQRMVKRGSRIFIEGKLQVHLYDEKGGGKKRYVEILAENMLLLDQKKSKNFDDSKETQDEIDETAATDEIPAFGSHQDEQIDEKRVNTFLF